MKNLESLFEDMRKQGLKITPQRRLIIQYIFENNAPVSAQEVFEAVRQTEPNISMDTVYRSLKYLCSINMLYKVEKSGKGSEYELLNGRHLHYMICVECGKREPFEDCAFTQEIISDKERKGFRLTGHKFELYGFCPTCDKK